MPAFTPQTPDQNIEYGIGKVIGALFAITAQLGYGLATLYILYRAMYALETISLSLIRISNHG
jgi:hypothetical protein